MDTQAAKVLYTEQERQRLFEEMIADHGSEWAEQYKPGSFGCHELLDRTALAADTVERYVLCHPACVQNKSWFVLAERAVAALRELYQQIGEEHLGNK